MNELTTVRNLCWEISRDGSLNASEHRILAYLLGIMPPNLRIEIGHREVARVLGISRPQVSRAMRRLENKRYITKLANRLYKFPDRFRTGEPVAGPMHSDSGKRPDWIGK